jgi:hypothetical protein
MSDMKDNRGKGILLLFLLINLTSCQASSWQSVSLGNLTPAQFIEAGKPESVRVILSDAPAEPVELIGPVVDGSTLRALDGVTVPIADILGIQLYQTDAIRSAGASVLVVAGLATALIAAVLIDCPPNDYTC